MMAALATLQGQEGGRELPVSVRAPVNTATVEGLNALIMNIERKSVNRPSLTGVRHETRSATLSAPWTARC
ncbi:hypothetical protein IV500_17875 [Paeniglutamicibacter antarcticus]|uniref:Uncharacterized protein n=1 Tax=Arthrobacter terrae TaxID=2935737 RepID=A0A931G9K3_9MICC|nr:hypothetical protein [Arthrobacter terrae]MBG0741239.1 hypothetical protein [Arthrobacter terrae]